MPKTAEILAEILGADKQELIDLMSQDVFMTYLGAAGRGISTEKKEQIAALNLNGIEFENAVYATAYGCDPTGHKWEHGIRKVASIIKGAPVQIKAQREIKVGSMDFLVYGVLDALKAGTIYDIKFSNKSFNSADLAGKYLTCSQHPIYFYIVPEANEFQYLVSDGEDLYIESYQRKDTPFIGDIIGGFIDGIKSEGLLDVYKQKWCAK